MILSSNEISGLVLKSARGAGLPLGFADALSEVAPLLARDAHWELVMKALSEGCIPPQIEIKAKIVQIDDGSVLARIMAALDFLRSGHMVDVDFADAQTLASAMAKVRGMSLDRVNGFWVSAGKSQADFPVDDLPVGAISVPQTYLDLLNEYAAKILVPETAQSRLSGAGAGLTDND